MSRIFRGTVTAGSLGDGSAFQPKQRPNTTPSPSTRSLGASSNMLTVLPNQSSTSSRMQTSRSQVYDDDDIVVVEDVPVSSSSSISRSSSVRSSSASSQVSERSLSSISEEARSPVRNVPETRRYAAQARPRPFVAQSAPTLPTTIAPKRPLTAGALPRARFINLGRKELLGKGSFGMVFRGIDLETNRLVAVKEISLVGATAEQVPMIRREICLMEKLHHVNIVQCLGHDCDDQNLRIYMEFVAGGSVSSILRSFGPFQERQASILTRQMLEGLQYLHTRSIAHRDLKGENLLLDTNGTVKLADFGTAKELATQATSLAGTAYFMAPEVIKGTGHGLEADIWSVGCCVIEMLTGKPPFSNLTNQYAIMMHVAESENFEGLLPTNISLQAADFIRHCMVRDPSQRATCEQLLRETWITDPPAASGVVKEQAATLDSGSEGTVSAHQFPSRPSNGSNGTYAAPFPVSSINPLDLSSE